MHRDLKPENILLTKTEKIKIIDFGTAKVFPVPTNTPLHTLYKKIRDKHTQKKNALEQTEAPALLPKESFVGTAQYMAPEMIANKNTGPACDLWAFGLILYKMITGQSLFKNIKEYVLYDTIKTGNFEISQKMDPDLKDLICKLLVLDPVERLGAGKEGSWNSFERLKGHRFFGEGEMSTEGSLEGRVVLRGVVGRRGFFFYERFELLLFEEGFLSLVGAKKKMDFVLNRDFKCRREGKGFFSLQDKKKKVCLKVLDKTNVKLWVEEISKVIG